jgi:short-subunit dehydrogenase
LTARKELAEDGIVVSLVYPGLTDTDFRNNAIKTKAEFMPGRSRTMPIADPPEKVADRILQVLESGEAEVVL